MHSSLLIGPPASCLPKIHQLLETEDLRAATLENHPDIFYVPPQTLMNIKTVRELKVWASRKPYQSTTKAAIILNAHTASIPAQNALLKLLEEPPPDTIIILTTPNQNSLLPTIISRCQVISVPSGYTLDTSRSSDVGNLLNLLPSLSPGERLSRVGKYATSREESLKFTEELIAFLRQGYYPAQAQQRVIPSAQHLRLALETLKRLKANVNPKLSLEHLFLSW